MTCIKSGKIVYPTKRDAVSAAAMIAKHKHQNGSMAPYVCKACGNWHLTRGGWGTAKSLKGGR